MTAAIGRPGGDRPEIVCLCGSTRFVDEFRAANLDLTLAGVIVLAPGVFAHAGDPITDEQKAALDALHLATIDLADRVVVVNPGGYIGESTRREIQYAQEAGKPVEYTDRLPPRLPVSATAPDLDDVGPDARSRRSTEPRSRS